jgi:serine protease
MAYWGGPVQTTPKEYLVFWGWGEPGAFPHQTCASENITEGSLTATLACDPDGAGKYMADFVQQMGGTGWANVSTQYYETNSAGAQQYVTNPSDVLAGIWADDSNDITGLATTSGTAPAGSGNTYYDLAAEAQRAIAHFGITDLTNANIIIAQPPAYSDPNALSLGYCAFHDYTDTRVPANSYYKGPDITQAFSYTNMPYQLAINSNGVNLCGENAVNTDIAGKLDGFSIVLGHEIEETITDPGAEDVVSTSPLPGNQTYEGGWYDPVDANENGDKCAWVGENLITGQGPPEPIYGALGDITGNAGERFAVQSLWSNAADEGTGYCAGAGTDSPLPSATYGSSPTSSGSGGSSSGSSSSSASSSSSSGSSAPAATSPSTTSSPQTTPTQASTSKHKATHKKRRRHRKRRRRVRRHRR